MSTATHDGNRTTLPPLGSKRGRAPREQDPAQPYLKLTLEFASVYKVISVALTPIEVKWSENPTLQAARHLLSCLGEHPKQAKQGYIVCRCARPAQLHEKITALPWFCL